MTAASQTQPRLPDDLDRLVDPALLRKPDGLTVACYTFPHFHRSAYNDRLYAPGWTEYILMRGCRPWFPGHNQPRAPMLGELDERLPSTWDVYLDLAKEHGVDAFIFDWYWYGGGPALHEALEEGFLGSERRDGVQFAVMWTNHPWAYWFPTAGVAQSDQWPEVREPSGLGAFEFVDPGPMSLEETWRGLTYAISRYFHDPGYWRIDGQPVLVIWDVGLLVRTFGADGTRRALRRICVTSPASSVIPASISMPRWAISRSPTNSRRSASTATGSTTQSSPPVRAGLRRRTCRSTGSSRLTS